SNKGAKRKKDSGKETKKSKSGKNGKGLTQKQQIEVMKNFKNNTYNVLISTSIGEEGLDIGEVDLIICFDVSDPKSSIQRMGRTGRKRDGRVVSILTEGAEVNEYQKSRSKGKIMNDYLDDKKLLVDTLSFCESPLLVDSKLVSS